MQLACQISFEKVLSLWLFLIFFILLLNFSKLNDLYQDIIPKTKIIYKIILMNDLYRKYFIMYYI